MLPLGADQTLREIANWKPFSLLPSAESRPPEVSFRPCWSSPAWNACLSGDVARLQEELTKGPAPPDRYGWTLLMAAAANGLLEVRERPRGSFPLAHSPAVGLYNSLHANLITLTQVVEYLLQDAAGVHARDQMGRTALMRAALTGGADVIQRLLQAGAEVDAQDAQGLTALALAACVGRVEIVTLMADLGRADVDCPDKAGQTVLIHAAANGHASVVARLLQWHGARIDTRDEGGRTALRWAEANGYAEVQAMLVSGPV